MNALCITFDNLGEAAEIQMGERSADDDLGGHHSVEQALPRVLELLGEHDIPATFFAEGLNTEVYPDALKEIAGRGHEVAYHAWCHEQWHELSDEDERENLERGASALRDLGLEPRGFRPPGGQLNDHTLEALEAAGFSYVSPEGDEAGPKVIPFRWPEVDAFHVLPVFEDQRRELLGDAEPGGVNAIRRSMFGALDRVADNGGATALVLHNGMIEMEDEMVAELFAEARRRHDAGALWLARCNEVAAVIAD